MEISIIIPTYNRAAKLPDTLKALIQQTDRNFELVIVIDGSTDNSLDVLEGFKSDFNSLKIVSGENGGRAIARNRGAEAASGKYFIFIDDDVRLYSNAVALHRKFNLEYPGQIIFGHLEIDNIYPEDDFLNYRRTVEAKGISGIPLQISFDNYAFTSANLSMSSQLFFELGGFNPELKDSEDFDFSVRAILKNITIKSNEEIRGFHDDFVTLDQYIRRQKQYLLSKYILLEKHPDYKEMLPSQFLWMLPRKGDALKNQIFGNHNFWMNFFSSKFFLFLPSALKHQLYSSFIYTQSVLQVRQKTNA